MQSELLKKYHIVSTADFYQKRGAWSLPKEKYNENKETDVEPVYGILKMPGNEKEKFVLLQSYVYSPKENLLSWLAADTDGNGFGRLSLYYFMDGENLNGPYQIESKIENDPVVSKELTLLNNTEGTVARGKISIVPIKNSLLFVKPIYILPNKDSDTLPEIKRVIVVYGEKIVIKPTLDAAIGALFGVNRPTVVTSNEETLDEIIEKVVEGFEEMTGFSKSGDWENYGKALKKLEGNIAVLKEKNEENAVKNEEAKKNEENENFCLTDE